MPSMAAPPALSDLVSGDYGRTATITVRRWYVINAIDYGTDQYMSEGVQW